MILKSNGYKELNLDLSKGRRMEKTLSKLKRKYPKKYYSILEIKINVRLLKINYKFSIDILQKIVLADLSARLVGIAD